MAHAEPGPNPQQSIVAVANFFQGIGIRITIGGAHLKECLDNRNEKEEGIVAVLHRAAAGQVFAVRAKLLPEF